ncbi:MAG: metallophosphoesterase family protein [Verrucomicrobiales bacterium]|nr:metallophosphoesterase family protein [Verrucomicrobiales bacterium]
MHFPLPILAVLPPALCGLLLSACNDGGAASADGKTSLQSTASSPIPGGLTRQPYLQLATPNSIRIVWRQREETQPVVKWGDSPTTLTRQVTLQDGILVRTTTAENGTSADAKPLHSAPAKTRQFEACLSGLEPDKKYYYGVFNGAKQLTPADETCYFRTLPVPGTERPAWMWVAGDGGTGGRIQAAVHTAMVDFTKQHNVALDMFLHVGDMAYQNGLDSEFQGRFFEMYGATLRNTVCWPAMGNHEGHTSKGFDGVGPFYDAYVTPTKGEAGGVPSGREAYYSFDFGKIHFIVLDSCRESFSKKGKFTPLGDAMLEWLKADLEKAKADWMIAYWHHPPYTKGSHDSDSQADYESIVMRGQFLPLLESAGVDLVLAGHSHIYERSMLVDGAYSTPTTAANVVIDDGDGDPAGDGAYKKSAGLNPHEGTVNIVTGNSGTSLKRMGTMPVMKRIILEHGSVLLNINGNTLNGLMLNKDGQRRDVFQIVKSGKLPARQKIAVPKPPPPMPQVKFVKADGSAGEDSPKKIALPYDPTKFTALISNESEWKYHLGSADASWAQPAYDDSRWPNGKAGFGYGDDDDTTEITMAGKHRSVALRKPFTLTGSENLQKLCLLVQYDDAFIAYLNGREVARSKNVSGTGATARVSKPHEAILGFEEFPLASAAGLLKPGRNVLAVVGFNDDIDSSDFSLHPALVLKN